MSEKYVIPGSFFVFEGAECCGKGTQAKLFADYLRKNGSEVCATEEPWKGIDPDTGKRLAEDGQTNIKKQIQKRREVVASENANFEKFNEDRKRHLELLIEPKLAEGKDVVCDRYFYSSIVYQGEKLGYAKIITESEAHLRPDICFYLKISVNDYTERFEEANRKRGELHNSKYEYPERVRKQIEGYDILAERDDFREIVVIDGTGSEEKVHQRIVKAYEKWLIGKYTTLREKIILLGS